MLRTRSALSGAAVAVLLISCLASSASADWKKGRITWYDDDPSMTVDYGSCGFGYIDQGRFPGYHVGAMADVNPQYSGSCGRCYEVKCDPSNFKDNYGEHLERSSVCYDPKASVVITITDTCACHYPSNYYSNKRWCCGDMDHLDISKWAFEKLADVKWGVIAMQYRQVACGTQPWKPAQLPSGKSPSYRRPNFSGNKGNNPGSTGGK